MVTSVRTTFVTAALISLLAHGTPAAVVDVYGDWLGTEKPNDEDATAESYQKGAFNQPEYLEAMNALDDRYREWILKTH